MAAKGRYAGFTLVELLVVIMIMAVIGSVVIAAFAGGMRAYERVHDFGTGEADAYLAAAFIERDLRNAVFLQDIPFQGDSSVMQFAARRFLPGGSDDAGDVLLVRYRYDSRDGLVRSEAALREGGFSVDGETIAGRSTRVEFLYAGSDGGDDAEPAVEWQSSTNLPRRVFIRFVPANGKESAIECEVVLPLSSDRGE